MGYNQAGVGERLLVNGVTVLAIVTGTVALTMPTPMGNVEMPYWCGWRTDERIAVLCVGAQ